MKLAILGYVKYNKDLTSEENLKLYRLNKAAPELFKIAKAYRNLLKTMAHTDGEIATYHHIQSIIERIENEQVG